MSQENVEVVAAPSRPSPAATTRKQPAMHP